MSNDKYKVSKSTNPDQIDYKKRRVVNFLPGYLQTDTMQKMFSASVDQMFQPQNSEELTGYIGLKPSYYDSTKDFYVDEPYTQREAYQLTPVAVQTLSSTGVVDKSLFYDDLVNHLRFQGALTDNHDRLFSQNYYSWCPPIDLDKLINYREYYWLPAGPEAIDILVGTNADRDIVGQKYVTLNLPSGLLDLSSGMKIKFFNDTNASYNGFGYIVEGVGRSIQLIPDYENNSTWDTVAWDTYDYDLLSPTSNPDYIVMERGAFDGNDWSRYNRWFHKDVIGNFYDESLIKHQAQRPIIEFTKNLELFEFGFRRRPAVTLVVDNNADILSTINGIGVETQNNEYLNSVGVFVKHQYNTWPLLSKGVSEVYVLNANDLKNQTKEIASKIANGYTEENAFQTTLGQFGTQLRNGTRLLVLSDKNPGINNRIYEVTGIEQGGIQLNLVSDNMSVDGIPTYGESVRANNPDGTIKDYWYNGLNWVDAQTKTEINQDPLFALYDVDANMLGDAAVYPNSSFNGSKIFTYAENTTSGAFKDTVLNRPLRHDSNGQILFENKLGTERFTFTDSEDVTHEIVGYYFHKLGSLDSVEVKYSNDWHVVPAPSTQEIIYASGDDFYDTPINLTANPTNEQVTFISKTQFFEHFATNIKTQDNFSGLEFGANNYRDTAKSGFLGKSILQHSAPMLKTMIMAASNDIDFMLSVRYSEKEYTRFKNKFIQKINDFYRNGTFTHYDDPDLWIKTALEQINLGKSTNFAYHNTGMAGNNTFIPPTPSFLGLMPVHKPEIFADTTYKNAIRVIRGHDGSMYPAFDPIFDETTDSLYEDIRNVVILRLEQQIYESIPGKFKGLYNSITDTLTSVGEVRPIFDLQEQIPGKFRTTKYSREEFFQLLTPMFERWVATNKVNYRENDMFSPDDPFTWNYSYTYDIFGEKLPGHWRAIYRHYFDTDRPHTRPWEMLGFTTKPEWWDEEYEDDNVTRPISFVYLGLNSNKHYHSKYARMWNDVANGIVRQGPRKNVDNNGATIHNYLEYIRPLKECLPVSYVRIGQVFKWASLDVSNSYQLGDIAVYDECYIEHVLEQNVWSVFVPTDEEKLSKNYTIWSAGVIYSKGDNVEIVDMTTGEKLYFTANVTHLSGTYFTKTIWIEPQTMTIDLTKIYRHWKEGRTFYKGEIVEHKGNLYSVVNDVFDKEPRFSDYTHYNWINAVLSEEQGFSFIDSGVFLDPVAAGITSQLPPQHMINTPWEFGDGGPYEYAWIKSEQYPFALSQVAYLMFPVEFVELGWDPYDAEYVFGQLIYRSTKNRPAYKDLVVHDELDENNQYVRKYGIQQWISAFLEWHGKSIRDKFGDVVRGLGVKMGHKVAGFVNPATTKAFADNFGLIPNENIQIALYRSPSIKEAFYGGVIIEWSGTGYRVFGYDVLDPVFKTIPGNEFGKKVKIAVGEETESYKEWKPNIYFEQGDLVLYQTSFFKAVRAHRSGNVFEPNFWAAYKKPTTKAAIEVLKYKEAKMNQPVVRIPYGTEFASRQEVFSFLMDYERFLVNDGWIFDEISDDNMTNKDWTYAGKQFLIWSATQWEPGTIIALSPNANKVKFGTGWGQIQPVEQIINGVYSLLNRDGVQIEPRLTNVTRFEGVIEIEPNGANGADNSLYAARLYISEIEHIILFDNVTIFGDVIYEPLYNLRQDRLKLSTTRSKGWRGRYEAPGFIITDNVLVPNYEKMADDFRYVFSIDDQDKADPKMQEYAFHTIGYQSRAYLNNLIISNKSQLNFYQGMIQQKGAPGSLNKLLRSEFITQSSDLQFFEEWAFRVGQYGAVDTRPSIEFLFPQKDYKQNPQLVEFNHYTFKPWIAGSSYVKGDLVEYENKHYIAVNSNSSVVLDSSWQIFDKPSSYEEWQDFVGTYYKDDENDDIINIATVLSDNKIIGSDSRWKRRPDSTGVMNNFIWDHRDEAQKKMDLPNAGYMRMGDFTYSAFNKTELLALYSTLKFQQDIIMADGETIWVIDNSGIKIDTNLWSVYRVTQTSLTVQNVNLRVDVSDPGVVDIVTEDGVDSILQVGDVVVLTPGPTGTFEADGMFEVLAVGSNTFRINNYVLTRNILDITDPDNPQPTIMVLRKMRFASNSQAQLASYIKAGEKYWVDNLNGGWAVMTKGSNTALRSQKPKVDTWKIDNAVVYGPDDNKIQVNLQVFDPYKGIVPGVADKEIWYKLDFDPAVYTVGDNTIHNVDVDKSWGNEEVGRLWWDLGTARYLDYEQGDNDYRRQHWGQLAPGASVDVYEWVKSTLTPAEYNSRAKENNNIAGDRITNDPSGEVYKIDTPAYVKKQEWDDTLGQFRTYYFFWVKGKITLPAVEFRKISALRVADILTNPSNAGIAWFAPIAKDALIVSGVFQFLTDDNSILQVNWKIGNNDGNIHREFILGREGDSSWLPDEILWNKMRDSLVGFDDAQKVVPDPHLSSIERLGVLVRPRQTMFDNMLKARRNFVECANRLLKRVPVTDSRIDWAKGLLEKTQEPTNVNFTVDDITQRDFLLETNSVETGQTVLVKGNVDTLGFWSVWKLSNAQAGAWVLADAQTYNIEDFWSYEDYYDDAVDRSVIPHKHFKTILDRNNKASTLVENEIILLKDNGSNVWEWQKVSIVNNNPFFTTVAKQNATIKLSSKFYKNVELYGVDEDWSQLNFKSWVQKIRNRDGSLELKKLLAVFRNHLLETQETNELFFAMVNYAHVEQRMIDWAFKTSYITIGGYVEDLRQDPVVRPDITESLLNYIAEAKPYHVKIRDYARRLSVPMDVVKVHVTDFDKPPMLDTNSNQPRILFDGTNDTMANDTDATILKQKYPWKDWSDNYLDNPELIRNFTITQKFDRVSCKPQDTHPAFIRIYCDGTQNSWSLIPDDLMVTMHPSQELDFGNPNILKTWINEWQKDALEYISIKDNNTKTETILRDDQWILTKTESPYWTLTLTLNFTPNQDQTVELARRIYTAERLNRYYNPIQKLWTGNNVKEIIPNLSDLNIIKNCDYLGTVVDGDTFLKGWAIGGFDMDPWDDKPQDDYYDLILNNNGNNVGDTLEGGRFTQPQYDPGHPEELVRLKTYDPLLVSVYNKQYPGSPMMMTTQIMGTGNGPFSLNQLAQSKEAIMVHKNGVLLEELVDYIVDWDTLMITFYEVLESTDIVIITSFALGGNFFYNTYKKTQEEIVLPFLSTKALVVMNNGKILGNKNYRLDGNKIILFNTDDLTNDVVVTHFESVQFTEYFAGNGTHYELKEIPAYTSIVTLNGRLLRDDGISPDYQIVVENNKATMILSEAPVVGSNIVFAAFDYEFELTKIRTQHFDQTVIDANNNNGQITLELSHPSMPSFPDWANMIVYKDGYRLDGPDTEYYKYNGVPVFSMDRTLNDLKSIAIFKEDGTRIDPKPYLLGTTRGLRLPVLNLDSRYQYGSATPSFAVEILNREDNTVDSTVVEIPQASITHLDFMAAINNALVSNPVLQAYNSEHEAQNYIEVGEQDFSPIISVRNATRSFTVRLKDNAGFPIVGAIMGQENPKIELAKGVAHYHIPKSMKGKPGAKMTYGFDMEVWDVLGFDYNFALVKAKSQIGLHVAIQELKIEDTDLDGVLTGETFAQALMTVEGVLDAFVDVDGSLVVHSKPGYVVTLEDMAPYYIIDTFFGTNIVSTARQPAPMASLVINGVKVPFVVEQNKEDIIDETNIAYAINNKLELYRRGVRVVMEANEPIITFMGRGYMGLTDEGSYQLITSMYGAWVVSCESEISTEMETFLRFADTSMLNPGDNILVRNIEGAQYSIDGNTMVIDGNQTVKNITVMTFNSHNGMGIRTERMVGNKKGVYKISQMPDEPSHIWVNVNGKLQVYGTDFELGTDNEQEWDSLPWDIEPFDQTDSLVIKFRKGHSTSAKICVTTFAGTQSRPAVAWRMYRSPKGQMEYTRISDANKTYLGEDVLFDSQTIKVRENTHLHPALRDPTPLAKPNRETGVPGTIWIGAERINYWTLSDAIVENGVKTWILGDLERGTKHTSEGAIYNLKTKFFAADGEQTRYMFSDDANITPKTVIVQTISTGSYRRWDDSDVWDMNEWDNSFFSNAYDTTLIYGVDYVVENNEVVFSRPPRAADEQNADGTMKPNLRVFVVEYDWDALVCHQAGSVVIDANMEQHIPGGYEWKWNINYVTTNRKTDGTLETISHAISDSGVDNYKKLDGFWDISRWDMDIWNGGDYNNNQRNHGLQWNDDAMSKFLLNKPGTPD